MSGNELSIVSLTGATHDGQPLGYGRAPPPDIRPWFSRLSVSEVLLPEGTSIECGIFTDHPVIRIMFGCRWTAQTADGVRDFHPDTKGQTLYFGPNTRLMPLVVHGSFKVITLNLAAGATAAMGGPLPEAMLDRIIDYDEMVGHGHLSARFTDDQGPNARLDALEGEIRKFVKVFRTKHPDPLGQAFDNACLADPTLSIAQFAASQGVTTRTLERCIKRDFGLAPKQALRRARAMDMAAILLGVAMEEEEEEIRLRYFDQSHLAREIRHFFSITPRQLREGNHPLLRIGLEIRQSRRVEALALLGLDQPKPWRDPRAEPSR